jgi:hypothetical protein
VTCALCLTSGCRFLALELARSRRYVWAWRVVPETEQPQHGTGVNPASTSSTLTPKDGHPSYASYQVSARGFLSRSWVAPAQVRSCSAGAHEPAFWALPGESESAWRRVHHSVDVVRRGGDRAEHSPG